MAVSSLARRLMVLAASSWQVTAGGMNAGLAYGLLHRAVEGREGKCDSTPFNGRNFGCGFHRAPNRCCTVV